MSPVRSALIVVEGVDGSGTTTQSRRLVEALRAIGRDARHTFEPTPGPIGNLIRAALEKRLIDPESSSRRALRPETMALLFAADRLDHLDSFILPALAEGAIVVSDRYDLSSLVYQSATSDSAAEALPWLRTLNRAARRPDLTVVLDVPFEVAKLRRSGRGGPDELFDADALQRRLVEVYARAEELVPGDNLVHLSGVGEPDEVTRRLAAAVGAALGT